MTKIAIVGNIASGKSTVEKILEEIGYKVYDTDKIAHKILENSQEIRKEFPQAVTDNKINRKILGQIVFNDKEKLNRLESIIHPEVRKFIINLKTNDTVFISVPQLFEAGFESLFDKILFISADTKLRLKRLMSRNNLSEEEALKRINAQLSESVKIPKCSYVVENNGTEEELKLHILHLFDYKS